MVNDSIEKRKKNCIFFFYEIFHLLHQLQLGDRVSRMAVPSKVSGGKKENNSLVYRRQFLVNM